VKGDPAQRPDPSVTTWCNEAPIGHACRSGTNVPSDPNQSPQRNCDPNIVVNATTSCAFADNAFYEYYKAKQSGKASAIEVYSPTTHKNYELDCETENEVIGCGGSPIALNIYTSFSKSAMEAYDEQQATAYAASHAVGNPPHPYTPPPSHESQQSPSKESGGGGADEVGSYSHASDESFCQEHECIGEFESEDGYIVECQDGTYSHAGGKSGACSDHGGIRRRS
jgi:hypothetical protein